MTKPAKNNLTILDRQKVMFSLSREQAEWINARFLARGERSAWIRDAIEIKKAIESGKCSLVNNLKAN